MTITRKIKLLRLLYRRHAEQRRHRTVQREFEDRITVRALGDDFIVCFDGYSLWVCSSIEEARSVRGRLRYNATLSAIQRRQKQELTCW